jgi:hypothetical protein
MDDYFRRVKKRIRSARADEAWLFAVRQPGSGSPSDAEDASSSDAEDYIPSGDEDEEANVLVDIVPCAPSDGSPVHVSPSFWVALWSDLTCTFEPTKAFSKCQDSRTRGLLAR